MHDTYITFTGWVGTTPELRVVGAGQPVASFRVGSTPRRLKDGEWVDGTTTWYQVKAWRRLAEHVAASLHTGDPVVVHGRLVADVWEKEDGTTVTQYVVIASSVGHDLGRGTSTFDKAAGGVPAVTGAPEPESEPGSKRAETAPEETRAA